MLLKKHTKAGLLVLLVLMFSVIAAACSGTEIKEIEVIKEITKEVPVEVVKEVVKEVEVEKVIVNTVEKEVLKEVEKIVEVEATKEKREIVFGGLDWTSALVQNGVARYIVEHGYGYPTSQIEGS
ncbi:uncharacterized protein METZ01_LOCUS47781, partial [marine metagenome]